MNNNDENVKIYSNFIDNEFENLSLKQAHRGETHYKFQEQEQWSKAVANAVASIVDEGVIASAQGSLDNRPKLLDKRSGRYILVDSGASRSIWPVSDFKERPPDLFKALKAVNNSQIQTFGVEKIQVQVSKDFSFTHEFILLPLGLLSGFLQAAFD